MSVIQPTGASGSNQPDITARAQELAAKSQNPLDNGAVREQLQLPGMETDTFQETAEKGTADALHTGLLPNLGKKTTGVVGKEEEDPTKVGAGKDTSAQPEELELPGGPPPNSKVKTGTVLGKDGKPIPSFTGGKTIGIPLDGVKPRTPFCGGGPCPGGPDSPSSPGPVPPGGGGGATPPGPGPTPPPGGQYDPSPQSTAANMAQIAQQDALQANQIYWQMYAERQKAMWKIFQLLQDLQTDIYKTISEAAANRAKVMDGIAAKWAQVLGA